jgi:proton-coupled amino acid transporter
MMQRAKTAALAKDPSKAELTTSYSGLAVATIGDLGGNITQLMVLVCCFGIASAYLVFVASTLATILPVSQTNLIIAITPVMVALAWLRSFSGVSLISLLGNVSVTVGMTAVLVYASKLGFNWTAVPAANIAAFPAAFGSVAFLFFVHFTMPPIEAAMAQPEKFYDASLNAFAISTVITATFGTIGAVCFGPMVPSVVITAMKGATVVAAVKLLLCLNLLCTFPIIVRGAFQILEGFMGGEENLSDPVIYSMRTVFVVLAAVCGVAIPSFGKLLGLVGGVSCTALTMIFPPIMLLATVKNISELEKIILYAIMAAGAGIAGLSIVS